jgi:hypothetical protein
MPALHRATEETVYYSFKVRTNREVALPDYGLIIGPGLDVFSACVENLESFKERLQSEDAVVEEVNRLDAFEPVEPCYATITAGANQESDHGRILGTEENHVDRRS